MECSINKIIVVVELKIANESYNIEILYMILKYEKNGWTTIAVGIVGINHQVWIWMLATWVTGILFFSFPVQLFVKMLKKT